MDRINNERQSSPALDAYLAVVNRSYIAYLSETYATSWTVFLVASHRELLLKGLKNDILIVYSKVMTFSTSSVSDQLNFGNCFSYLEQPVN